MATKLVYPQMPSSNVSPSKPRRPKKIRILRVLPATHSGRKNTNFGRKILFSTKVTEQGGSGIVGDDDKVMIKGGAGISNRNAISQIKADLYCFVQGINRGIFGVPSAKKSAIETLVKSLESQNPTPEPTRNLEKVDGCWKLIYTTITILGAKRTKLGLRDFVTLGEFFQTIDVAKGKAVNVIKFSARGLNLLNGQLTIEGSFTIASKTRVDISYENSTVTPDQLMNLFRKNYGLLLSIFNPEGWHEITYVDDTLRIGRDDKGNLFILERSDAEYRP